ncbi:MAG: F0F1 ATP synthase subunit B [Hyphomicrobiales bacterium]|nr:MAG: F0F1 ATP synthase subunit B [Hyphomicrobiales bacterium]
MLHDPTFWVAVGMAGFIAMLVYLGVPKLAVKALDDRAEAIKNELETARKLKEEAQHMLAEYERKQQAAVEEAQSIVAQAKEEAEALAAETEKKLTETIDRRTKMAENKILQAQLQARKNVQAYAADIAVAATEEILANDLSKAKANSLIDDSIASLKQRLN